MGAARQLDIKNHILSRTTCLGNSKIGFKEVCSQLIDNEINKGRKLSHLADQTYLSLTTLERMWKLRESESGLPYRPTSDTCVRILKAFGAQITFEQVKIKGQFANKPKEA